MTPVLSSLSQVCSIFEYKRDNDMAMVQIKGNLSGNLCEWRSLADESNKPVQEVAVTFGSAKWNIVNCWSQINAE